MLSDFGANVSREEGWGVQSCVAAISTDGSVAATRACAEDVGPELAHVRVKRKVFFRENFG